MLTGISNAARLILNQKYSTLPCSWQLFSTEEVEITEFFIQPMTIPKRVHVCNNNNRGDIKIQCKKFWFGLVLNENRKKNLPIATKNTF